MSELAFARIALIMSQLLMTGLIFCVVFFLHVPYFRLLIAQLASSSTDLTFYVVYLGLCAWVLRYFSFEMRGVYMSLMPMLFAALWLWFIYLTVGGIYPDIHGIGSAYVDTVAGAINRHHPFRQDYLAATLFGSLMYGIAFLGLMRAGKKWRMIKVPVCEVSL